MQQVVTYPTDIAQWHALLNEAQMVTPVELTEDVESYLVFMLMRYTKKTDMGQRVIGMDYLECFHSHGEKRFLELRDVGDQCLLLSSLFPERAERKRVKVSYFVDIGRSAYANLAVHDNQWEPLFADLSASFPSLKTLLASMRIRRGSHTCSISAG